MCQARDLQIQGLQAEVALLRRQLAQTPRGSDDPAPSQPKRPRLLAAPPAPSPAPSPAAAPAAEPAAALALWDALLTKELIMVVFLGNLSSPTFAKLENLSKKSQAVLKRFWPRSLDLSEVGREGGACWFPSDKAAGFQKLLAQPKWKQAQVLRFPVTWYNKERSKYGRKHILTEETMKAIARNLTELEEVDLLPYNGTPWTEMECRINQFCSEFSRLQNLRSLKMEMWSWGPLRILPRFPNLRIVHFKVPGVVLPPFDPPETPFRQLRCLHFLEELCLFEGSWVFVEEGFYISTTTQTHETPRCIILSKPSGSRWRHLGLTGHGGELQSLLQDCPALRHLDIAAFIDFSHGPILPSLAAHPRLESLAFFAGPSMNLAHVAHGLTQLAASTSLKKVRVVQAVRPVGFVNVRAPVLLPSIPGIDIVDERKDLLRPR